MNYNRLREKGIFLCLKFLPLNKNFCHDITKEPVNRNRLRTSNPLFLIQLSGVLFVTPLSFGIFHLLLPSFFPILVYVPLYLCILCIFIYCCTIISNMSYIINISHSFDPSSLLQVYSLFLRGYLIQKTKIFLIR